jgi:hypothetical protein
MSAVHTDASCFTALVPFFNSEKGSPKKKTLKKVAQEKGCS